MIRQLGPYTVNESALSTDEEDALKYLKSLSHPHMASKNDKGYKWSIWKKLAKKGLVDMKIEKTWADVPVSIHDIRIKGQKEITDAFITITKKGQQQLM